MVKENNPGSNQNIFSKFYNYLESKYNQMSNWLTEKGIPLNSLNEYLENKGLPAFAIISSIFLLLLFIILFLIFFTNQSTMTFEIKDFQGTPVDNAYLVISDSKKEVFSGIIENNSSKKIKLKVGDAYLFKATNESFPNFENEIKITDKQQKIIISFSEKVEYGFLKIKLRDRENQKTISSGMVTANYTVNNKRESIEGIVDIFNNHFITLEVPLNKDIELLVKADGYEDYKENNFRISSLEQEKIIELDLSTLSFEGKSKVTFIVLDEDDNLIDDAEVSVFNIAQEEIANQKTIDGKALAYINTGESINYIVKKDGYRTYLSDENVSIRILNLEETFTIVLKLGGNLLDVNVRAKSNFLALDDVLVTLYNSNNTVIDSNKTDFLGDVSFKGINVDDEILVVACKDDYLCESKLVDLDQESKAEFILERIDLTNSSILNIFVVDEKNMPISNASIKIYELLSLDDNVREIPYNTSLKTDVVGSLGVPLRVNKNYRIFAIVGESQVFEDITIDPLKENKIIFMVDNASKMIKLDLYDENGYKINDGHLLIKTKDGTVLYDENLSMGQEIIFNSQGYKDFIAEYTDPEGKTSVINFNADEADSSGYIKVDLNKEVNTSDYPIIEFVGVVDGKGLKTNYITTDKEYYLVFDVLFPENTYKGEVHIRAGEDTQNDSEEMSYGITGFMAMDITDFRYGTTYNNEPAPGMQSIDMLNEGSSQVLNKWLELKWSSDRPLGNKQIKIKVNAIDSTITKLTFKYRTLFEENKVYFRDPIDPILNQSYSTNQRFALYADTKEVLIDLFDVPLDCKDDVCVSYKFIDSKDNEFNVDDFFAIKGEEYVLESSIYSFKNTQLDLLAETSKAFPLISFDLFKDNIFEMGSSINYDNFESTREGLGISSNALKKVYLSFIAKEIGTAYIDLKATDSILKNQVINERLSFNVYDKKEMRVVFNPDVFIQYGSKFNIEVYDSLTSQPIENAFITFYDERGQFISSQRAIGTNGKNGRYTIENNFNVPVVNVVVESYGYSPYKNSLYVIDDYLLTIEPREVLINLGLDQMVSSKSFNLTNNGEYVANNIRFGEPIWLDGSNEIFIDVRGPTTINKNSTQGFEVSVTVSNDLKFSSAYAKVPVYVTIGPREITKIVPVRINKGLLLDDCIEITPYETNTFVGLNLKYTPPNIFNTPFEDRDYTGMSTPQNPMLAPSQRYSSYSDYLESENYSINYSSSEDVMQYTDPNYYTYRTSTPKTTQEYTENTTFFKITNTCQETITFTPEAVLASSASNNDLEIQMPHMTIMPGEIKEYDVIVRNKSNRTQNKTYKYDVLWHNNYYSIEPSKLNIDLLDLRNALMIIPPRIDIPMSQVHPQQAADNPLRIFVKNIGTVPITDIQVSRFPKTVSSNIGVKIYPLEVPILMPGREIPIDLQFNVNVAKSTIDDMGIMVTGKAQGINDPIHATSHIIFTISAPNCLKVSRDKINYNLRIGETKSQNVTITNKCMEPVSITHIDKKGDMYFETFGENLLKIIPVSGIIYPNNSATYNLELKASSLSGSPNMPVVILGTLLNSGYPVSSEVIQVSVNVEDIGIQDQKDRDVSIISSIPICENPTQLDTFSRPQISIGTCTESSGYCDAYSSTELILRKINELSSQIKQFSSQAQSKTLNTGCPIQDAARGFCKISELGGDISPLEFNFYMQNDFISPDLVRFVLNKSNYNFKNYFIETNPFNTPGNTNLGVYAGGSKIFVSNLFAGCGRYKVELDGFIAASTDMIYPDRAYYFINVLEVSETQNCEKNIINYLNYLPWDLTLSKNQREGTWLTLFTGDENLSKDLIKGVGRFKNDEVDLRYVYQRDVLSTRNNTLNVIVDDILEDSNALAKIMFNDKKLYDKANPEQINVIFNKNYKTQDIIPEQASRAFINVMSSMISKNDYSAKVCVSEDNSYMLILDIVKAGDLQFLNKEPSLVLNEKEACLDLKIRSSVDETLKISSSNLSGLDVGFRINPNESLKDTINLDVLKNKDSNFSVCVMPKSFDQIQTLVNQKITVRADSIFSKDGTISNRNATVDVVLTSCGITPEDLLLKTYEQILNEHNKKEDNRELPKNIYALVDWPNSYSTQEKESLCDTLEKFMLSNNYRSNEKLFFNYENINCEIKDPDQKTDAKLNKGLVNAGNYFLRCAGTCATCYGLSAFLLPASIGGAVLDCGVFSCGLPALQVFAAAMTDGEGGIGWMLDQLFGFILNTEDFEMFGPLFTKVGEWIMGAIGSATAGILKTGSTVAVTPLTLTDNPTVIDNPFVAAPAAPAVAPGAAAPGVIVPPIGGGALSAAEVTNLNSQLKNLHRYVNPAPAGAINPITFNAANPADNLVIKNFVNTVTPAAGTGYTENIYNLIANGTISQAELDNAIRIIDQGTMTGRNAHMVKKDILVNRLRSARAGVVAPAPAPAVAPAGAAVPAGFQNLDDAVYNGLKNTVDDELIKVESSIKNYKAKIDAIENNNSRSSLNPKKVRVDPNRITAVQRKTLKANSDLTMLKSELAKETTRQQSLQSLKGHLDAAVHDPATGQYRVSTQASDDIVRLSGTQSKVATISKKAKFKRGAGGFLRSFGCGILGNIAGVNGLKDKGKTNLNYSIEFNENMSFEKNIFYVVEMDIIEPVLDSDYKHRYVIDIFPYQETDATYISSMPSTRVDSCINN